MTKIDIAGITHVNFTSSMHEEQSSYQFHLKLSGTPTARWRQAFSSSPPMEGVSLTLTRNELYVQSLDENLLQDPQLWVSLREKILSISDQVPGTMEEEWNEGKAKLLRAADVLAETLGIPKFETPV